ncbi:MAG: hypothetical protein PXY39_06940 [archaeon]|nr:hypothetical protein [archaeon]
MIDLLITYIPLARLSDVSKYFELNYAILRPRRALVYVNDSDEPWIKSMINPLFEVKAMNLGDWNLCWMQIFRDLKADQDFKNAYVIDSDNVLPENFQKIDDEMEQKGYSYYTVQDKRANNLLQDRSSKIDDKVWKFRVRGSWRSIFFIGPKQGVRMSKQFVSSVNEDIISQITSAMERVHPKLRSYVSDDNTLGIVLYYSNIHHTPWIAEGTHFQTKRRRLDVVANALAHSMFARRMLSYHRDRWMLWYYLRNKISFLSRSVFV